MRFSASLILIPLEISSTHLRNASLFNTFRLLHMIIPCIFVCHEQKVPVAHHFYTNDQYIQAYYYGTKIPYLQRLVITLRIFCLRSPHSPKNLTRQQYPSTFGRAIHISVQVLLKFRHLKDCSYRGAAAGNQR